MEKSEQQIQKEITDYLKRNNYYVVKVIKATENGVPDILFCKDGKFCAIEVKARGKKSRVTELQKVHIDLINKTGGKAIVADDLFDVIEEF